MKSTSYSRIFSIKEHFPNAKAFRGWEGGCAFECIQNDIPYVIIDEGTLDDFLDEHIETDNEVKQKLITVLEFESESEKVEYVAKYFTFGVDLTKAKRFGNIK